MGWGGEARRRGWDRAGELRQEEREGASTQGLDSCLSAAAAPRYLHDCGQVLYLRAGPALGK